MFENKKNATQVKKLTGYEYIGWLLVFGGMLFPLAGCFMTPVLLGGVKTFPNQALLYWILICPAFLWTISFFWFSFVVPYRLSGDTTAQWGPDTLQVRKLMLSQLFRPVIYCQIPFFVMLSLYLVGLLFFSENQRTFDFFNRGLSTSDLRIWLPISVISGLGLIFFLPLFYILRRRIYARLYENLRARKICGQCSYDLRGNPDGSCPECGFDPSVLLMKKG